MQHCYIFKGSYEYQKIPNRRGLWLVCVVPDSRIRDAQRFGIHCRRVVHRSW